MRECLRLRTGAQRLTARAKSLASLLLLAALGTLASTVSARAQEGNERFLIADLLKGRVVTEAQCAATSSAVWISSVPGAPACIRYYYSEAGGQGGTALAVLPGNHLLPKPDGTRTISPGYDIQSPASLASEAMQISRRARMPALILARPGSYGSSGRESEESGTTHEAHLIAAALDEIRERHGLKGFHLAGQGIGGNLAATFATTRADVTCSVAIDASLSEVDRLAATNTVFDPANQGLINDPIAALPNAVPRDGLRLIAITDPANGAIPEAAPNAYVAAARLRGIPVARLSLPMGPARGDLQMRAIETALACARGSGDAEIAQLLASPPLPPDPAAPPSKPGTRNLTTAPQPIGPQVAAPNPQAPLQTPPAPEVRPAPIPVAPQPKIAAPSPQPAPQAVPPTPTPTPPPTTASPVPAPPASMVKFSRRDVLNGVRADQAACLALGTAVWVTGVGNPECIRYYYSTVGGTGNRTLLFMNGDFTYRGADGKPTVDAEYDNLSPSSIQHIADTRSRDYGGPMIYLARPGTFGSSGNELQVRHTPREVALVSAAVAEIKRRHGIEVFDIIGHSGGGLLLGALVATRLDIGCAASSSGVLATNEWISQRLNIPAPKDGLLYDPLDHVAEIRPGAKFRYFILTDLLDLRVSPLTTQLYLEALQARGVPFQHYRLSAGDEAHHDLALHAFRAVIACAHGAKDAEIAELLQKTVVTDKRMSEMGPIGDMPKPASRSNRVAVPDVEDVAPSRPGPQGSGGPMVSPNTKTAPVTPPPVAVPAQPQPQPQPAQPKTVAPQPAQPQTPPVVRPATPDDKPIQIRSTTPFRTEDLLKGSVASLVECERGGSAVLVMVERKAECVRYVLSTRSPGSTEAIVYLPWDQVIAPGTQAPTVRPGYEDVTTAFLGETADRFAAGYRRSFLFLSRPGTFGSSGRALDLQHTRREVDIVLAALDAIAARQGITKFHLIGQGGGAILVAAAAAQRRDIGCAIMSGGFLSVREGYRRGLFGPKTVDSATLYDPIDTLADLRLPGLGRLISLTDREDSISPVDLQDAYIDRLKAGSIPVLALHAQSFADDHHDLGPQALRAALACVEGANDAEITEFVARTPSPNDPAPQQANNQPDQAPRPPPAMAPKDMAHDPVPSMPQGEEQHFSAAELVSGKRPDKAECDASPTGLWLVVDNRPDCIMYFYSDVGGTGPNALVFMNGDMVLLSGPNDMLAARPGYEAEKPSDLTRAVTVWSRAYGGPVIYLARPGTFGSSGREVVDRRSNREVALIDAALSEIARRRNFTHYDVTGQSGGGHLTAALVARRSDIRCAVVSSGVLAVKDNEELRGRRHRPSDFDRFYDPILHVAEFKPRPDLRFFILSDPQDKVVTYQSTLNFVKALTARNFPFQIFNVPSASADHHDLALHGVRASIACAHDQPDAAIAKIIQATVVSHPSMSEMGPMGDMTVPANP